MKRSDKNLAYTEKRRGRSLDATGVGPYLKLCLVLLALIVAALAVIFLILPSLRGAIDWSGAFVRPAPPPVSTPGPTSLVPALIDGRVQNLKLDAEQGEAVLVDAALSEDGLIFASGSSEEACDRIVRVNLSKGKRETVTPALENDCLRMPRANGEYLVWFDAKLGGGGNICLRSASTGADVVLVQLETGLPELHLDGRYLLFKAESGLAVKLYAIDLASFEPVTLALLTAEAEAVSEPDILDGRVCFALGGGIRRLDLRDGEASAVETETYIHDPQWLDGGLIWLSGNHGEDTDIYYRSEAGDTLIIARGVIDAAAADNCIVYGRDGTVYAYSLLNGSFYMLSGAEEYAQLVTAGGDYALWRVLGEAGLTYRYLKVN